MTQANKPHQAVVFVQLEVHELLDTGECSAKIVGPKTLEQFELKPKQVLTIKGQTREECLKKLKGILDGFSK